MAATAATSDVSRNCIGDLHWRGIARIASVRMQAAGQTETTINAEAAETAEKNLRKEILCVLCDLVVAALSHHKGHDGDSALCG